MTVDHSTAHDPDARRRRTFDWSRWLTDGDTITEATVAVDDATVFVDGVAHDDSTVSYWISGGTAGTKVRVTCTVVTAAGEEDDRSVTLWVRHR